ncbi:MAG: PTS sugar transporter subunit IIA [Deltaproteobacteria bacterium]|nr:PTS sugar transporter subunit IIA [Deltaproteobacteria bacterium]MBN2671564.1 PTS sugar transporter subunit IIA [Deltaproteobacteria bacterium]
MQLTISQAASLLGTSEGMLERWARQGVLPTVETGDTFYFEEKELVAWAERRRMPLRDASTVQIPAPTKQIPLADAMRRGGFYYDVEGADVTSVLTALISRLEMNVNKDTVLQRVLEREALSSTGIGHGIAMPHPRQPLDTLDASAVVTCFPKHPIAYNAIDGKAVSVIFLVLSKSTQSHLKLLSQLSYILRQHDSTDFLATVPGADEIMTMVLRHAQELIE